MKLTPQNRKPFPEVIVDLGPKRYFLAQDNDSHWWVVPVDRRHDFYAWTQLTSEDVAGWTPPDFAIEVKGSPELVSFSDPRIEP